VNVAAERGSELRSAARGGAMIFAGAGLSAVLGFALNFMFARLLGPYGAGVVLQAVAVFSIVLSFAKFGLDTTAVWLLPRLVVTERDRVRSAVVALLVPAGAVATLVTAAWFAARPFLGVVASGGTVYAAITAVAVFLPAASVMTVALAATRAFGGVGAFNTIGNIVVPLLRPVGLLAVVAGGGAAVAASVSWALPWLVGAVAGVWVLVRQVRRFSRETAGPWRPSRATRRQVVRYSLPRTVMSGLEQAVIWLDVVLVGILLGSTQAGIYGSAARFVSAGVVVFTAVRIVVAPRFSALLAGGRRRELGELYGVTGRWILLFGAPIYITFAVFAPTVLGWLGPGFASGARSMVILCLGSISILAAGNVQSLLLMSGHVIWGVLNKVVVVAVNVALNLVLIPRLGITGAAAAWAASMVLDNALAALQVHRALGIGPSLRQVTHVALVVCGSVALPALTLETVLGQGLASMAGTVLVTGALLAGCCAWDRDRLGLRTGVLPARAG
jgi:O-antigen/teichoic acid export membrane protein